MTLDDFDVQKCDGCGAPATLICRSCKAVMCEDCYEEYEFACCKCGDDHVVSIQRFAEEEERIAEREAYGDML